MSLKARKIVARPTLAYRRKTLLLYETSLFRSSCGLEISVSVGPRTCSARHTCNTGFCKADVVAVRFSTLRLAVERGCHPQSASVSVPSLTKGKGLGLRILPTSLS